MPKKINGITKPKKLNKKPKLPTLGKNKEKTKITALELSLKKIEKMFGENAVSSAEKKYKKNIPILSTGLLSLDIALGVMGLPKGRIIEISGGEAAGKTSLVLQIIKSCQKRNGKVAYIDAEHALDRLYAKKSGVDLKKLLINEPKNGEQGLAITQILIESGEIDLIIIDSIAALVPQAILEGDMSDATIGIQARLISKALNKILESTSQTNTVVIFINQLRDKIGGTFGFGPKTTTPGGWTLKHLKSIVIAMVRIGQLKKGKEIIGIKTIAKISKNKVAPPFKSTGLKIYFDEGLSPNADLLNLGLTFGLIKKKDSWFYFKEEILAQGLNDARIKLNENPELAEELKELILNVIKEKDNEN